MANSINYIPQIDYTSRDYVSILEDLQALAKEFNPYWTSSDPTDMGVTLLELFAYLGDLLSFYIDRMANEGFLATASQRESLLQIAALLGYTPDTVSPATVQLLFSNTTGSSVSIPAGTQVASTAIVNGISTQIIFETNSTVSVPAAVGATPGQTTVIATQGETITDEILGISSGGAGQTFKLSQQPVIINSVNVYVNNVLYTYSPSLINNTIYDSVFTTLNDSEGNTYVVFGDGIGGRIPPASLEIKATYRIGNGADGNVSAGTLEKFISSSYAGVTVTNQLAATGGADEESNDSIRINAPRVFKSLNRAVSLKDYAYLALQVPGVSKAASDASVFSSVNLYVAPFGSTGYSYETATITGVSITATNGSAGTGGITYAATNTNFKVGDYVTVTGMVPNSYNVIDAVITARSGTGFTIASQATGTFVSGGTAKASIGLETSFTTVQANTLSYFTDKVAPNVTLNVLPGIYTPINANLSVQVLPQYNQQAVVSKVNSEIASLLSLSNSFFAEQLSPQQFINVVSAIPGVQYATVDLLRKAKDSQLFSVSSWGRSTNVVTLTLSKRSSGSHNITVGSRVKISGVNATFDTNNGTVVVTAVGTDTISFLNSGSDLSNQTPTSTSNYVRVIVVDSISCAINEIPSLGSIEITASGGII